MSYMRRLDIVKGKNDDRSFPGEFFKGAITVNVNSEFMIE